jgi:hypothetical protein
MPSTFPCPNPTCAHAFTPEAVKGAARLVCPRCGSIFQFRTDAQPATRPPAAQPAPPATAAKPRPAAPVRAPAPPPLPAAARPAPPTPPPLPSTRSRTVPVAPPAVPVAMPVASTSEAAFVFEEASAKVVPPTRRERPRPGRSWRLPVLIGMGVLGLGLAVWGGIWLHWARKHDPDNPDALLTIGSADHPVARFKPPGLPWKRDKNIELAMSVNIALRRSQPANYLAIYYRDYKTRRPSDAELIDEALAHLRDPRSGNSFFPNGVEWELKPRSEAGRLAGQPALHLEFQGDSRDNVPMNGECHAIAYRGFGLWFFTWAPLEQKDAASSDWEALAQGLKLTNVREGWTEKPRETEVVQGKKIPYRLTYVKELWTPQNAEDYDPLADVVLRGFEPDKDGPYAGKAATLRVLVLPKAANLPAATEAARAHVRAWLQKEAPGTTLEPIKDKSGAPIDRDTDIGPQRGHLGKFQVLSDGDPQRYVVLAVVSDSRGTIVLLGDCPWERRDFWEQEFPPLINSLKLKGR